MMFTCHIIIFVTQILFTILALSGEVILYNEFNDTQSDVVLVFSASETSGCLKAAVDGENSPYYYGVSASRIIAPTCTFYLYSDTLCSKLQQAVSSSSKNQEIRNIANGLRSYKVLCKPSSQLPGQAEAEAISDGSLQNLNARDDVHSLNARSSNYYELDDNYFFQPPSKFNGKATGGHSVEASRGSLGNTRKGAPKGSIVTAAVNITSTLFHGLRPNKDDQTFVVKSQGTTYKLIIQASSVNGYDTQKAVLLSGPASWASILADALAYLKNNPFGEMDFSMYYASENVMDVTLTYT